MNLMRRVLSTREGTIAFAVLAAVVLMAFTRGYKHSVERNGEEVTALVAKDALPKGSPGDVIAEKGLFQPTGFARDQVKDGAITDPATLPAWSPPIRSSAASRSRSATASSRPIRSSAACPRAAR